MEQGFILILMAENGKDNIEMVIFKLEDKSNFYKKNKYKSENNNQRKV